MKIKIIEGGPYKVTGGAPLVNALIIADAKGVSVKWGKGKEYPKNSGGEYYLCRCGFSENKPFCDGAHLKTNFNADEMPQVSRAKIYKGAKIDLIDEDQYCASVRFCDKFPRAWDAAIDSDKPGYEKAAIEECAGCASGRLTVRRKDGTLVEPILPKEISPVQDLPNGFRGPLWVKGRIQLEGADGRLYQLRNRMTLCRCGGSDNMPFCDTSHLSCPHMRGTDEN